MALAVPLSLKWFVSDAGAPRPDHLRRLEFLAEGWREPLPGAWACLPVYIDAVAELGEDGDVSNAVLDGLEKLRHAVRKALAGEALARTMDLE